MGFEVTGVWKGRICGQKRVLTILHPGCFRDFVLQAPTVQMPTAVCVTGASGFISSHIVAQLLKKGYAVKGTVRDAADEKKTAHLRNLPGADTLLELFSVNLVGEPNRFDPCLSGCEAVFHTATPVVFGAADGKKEIYEPAMQGTRELLAAVQRAGGIKSFVLTSSMSAVSPQPEPAVKSEVHWSDDAAQES